MKKIITVLLSATVLLLILSLLSGCGVKASEGLEFKSNGDGTCTWVGVGTCPDTAIVVPKTNGDETVTAVGENVIYGKTVTKVTLPDTVTVIKDKAFSHSGYLTEIDLGKGVTSIGENAFFHCEKLTAAELPDTLTSLGEYAFSGCDSLSEVTFGKGLSTINQNAFSDCPQLVTLNFSDSLRTIDEFAFGNDTALTEIILPDGIETVESHAFSGTTGVKKIHIPESLKGIDYTAFDNTALEEVEIEGEMKFYNFAGAPNQEGWLWGDLYREEEEYSTAIPATGYKHLVCLTFGVEKLKLNGEDVTVGAALVPGNYARENSTCEFELTETAITIKELGQEVAKITFSKNEYNVLTVSGSGTRYGQQVQIEGTVISLESQLYVALKMGDLTLHGFWNKV